MIQLIKWLLCLSLILPHFQMKGRAFFSDDIPASKVVDLPENEKLFIELQKIEANLSNPEEAIDELNLILPECIKKNYVKETAYAYILIGRCYKILQESSIALQYLHLAKKEFDKNNFQPFTFVPGRIKSELFVNFYAKRSIRHLENNMIPLNYYMELAEIYNQMGDYENSNTNYLILAEKLSINYLDKPFFYEIAQNYFYAKNYEKALEYYHLVLQMEKDVNSNLALKNCYMRIANCYFSMGDSENGFKFLSLSKIDIGQTVEDSVFKILNKGTTIETGGSLERYKPNKDYTHLSNEEVVNLEYLKLAKKYYASAQYSKAERALDKYFKNISYALFDEKEIQIIKDVARVINEGGKKEKALSYLLRYEELRDTIISHQVQNHYKSKRLGAAGLQNLLNAEKLQRDKEFDEFKITQLEKENNLRENLILILIIGLILGTIGIVYLNKLSKQRKSANQKLELRSLRSQMNPHFIFNALNSVNGFISLRDERRANSFLSGFSSLMRTVMENSEYDFITLTKELEIIQTYLKMEHFRFKDKFEYTIDIDESLDEDYVKLPPMLIQPYIENAIWHGLRYKTDTGLLNIILKDDDDTLVVTIQDNGIGRKRSKLFKTKNQLKRKSIALKNIDQRIQIFEELHKIKITVKIADLYPDQEDTGTYVELRIPQMN